jgi:hypothetical protein
VITIDEITLFSKPTPNEPVEEATLKSKELEKKNLPDKFLVHVCIPCKRMFRSFNALMRHRQDSVLHIKVICCQSPDIDYL